MRTPAAALSRVRTAGNPYRDINLARRAAAVDPSDPFAYGRTRCHLANGVVDAGNLAHDLNVAEDAQAAAHAAHVKATNEMMRRMGLQVFGEGNDEAPRKPPVKRKRKSRKGVPHAAA